MLRTLYLAISFAALSGGCETPLDAPVAGDPAQLYAAPPPSLPEPPAKEHDITRFTEGQWTTPHIPAHRTTRDGRIGLGFAGGSNRKFVLLAPEQLTQPVLESGDGISLTLGSALSVPVANFYDAAVATPINTVFQMSTICDDQPQIPDTPLPTPTSPTRDPYACGSLLEHDCYDFTVISVMQHANTSITQTQLWGRDVTIEVSDPKTDQAAIHGITYGATTAHTYAPGTVRGMWEPIVTEDGRLFVTRLGFAYDLTWTDSQGGTHTGRYDSVYSYNEAGDPCDVSEWHDSNLHPLSHAYYDTRLQGVYGIADYPMTDGEGNVLPDGEPVRATYPWIDRKGANFFFTTHGSNLHYIDANQTSIVRTRYPVRCLPNQPQCSLTVTPAQLQNGDIEATWNYQGVAMTGAWTHGRTVLLDGMINSVDYNLYHTQDLWREVQLYADESASGGDDGWIAMGNGRCLSGPRPPGHVGNCNVIDSVENLFNYNEHMVPQTPRDVVWFMSNGRSTDEVAFDDYLDKDMLIYSDMNASLTNEPPSAYTAYTWGTNPVVGPRLHIHDGFEVVHSRLYAAGFNEEVRFQNAATSTSLTPPAAGRAYALDGNIRVEPAAMGGVYGKGVWLNGTSGIVYEIPMQSLGDRDWFVSLFVDPRFDASHTMGELVRFPDGSAIGFLDASTLVFVGAHGQLLTLALPSGVWYPARAYNHLGFGLSDGGQTLDVYVNGFLFHSFTDPLPLHTMRPGHIAVGAYTSPLGFRGWVDEVKVIGRIPQPGTICNHARGHIVGIDPMIDDEWSARALSYPIGHQAITNHLIAYSKPWYEHYACAHDYTTEAALPPTTPHTRITQDLTFPEGPMVWNQPRPDSTNNAFCLSCHDAGFGRGLGMTALAPGAAAMVLDERRQPMMGPPWAGGYLPGGYNGFPMTPLTLPSTGYPFYDYFLFP